MHHNGKTSAGNGTATARPPKPTALEVLLENISEELQALKQWVMWRYDFQDGEWRKVPYRSFKSRAKSNDKTTWLPFKQVAHLYTRFREHFDGIGFMFAKDDPYCGVDLDDCLDDATGELMPYAQEIVARLASYAEISPSGRGVKIWVRGRRPAGWKDTKDGPEKIEIYDSGRYFAMTGHVLNGGPA